MKKALVTGASSGIGRDIALYLDSLGYKLILIGRNIEALEDVQSSCKSAKIIICDLSKLEEVYQLYNQVKKENITLLVNNAGFGLFGDFNKTDIDIELEMINVNIIAVHLLTKLFLKDFIKKDKGRILNVASSAGFLPGPRMSTYYGTKNYVLKISLAIYEELRKKKSNVKINCLCPGPVVTNFQKRAGVSFTPKNLSSEYVAKYAVDKMLKDKLIIIPSFRMKLNLFVLRFIPTKILLKIVYNVQKEKKGK